jgi:cyclopropane fatty-acyl-phospholipid synthase-like methyltransferase
MTKFNKSLERWNDRFSASGYLFGEAPNHFLQKQQKILPPGNALSIADGEGRNSVWLAEQGLTVDAFDFSPVGIQKAKQLARSRHVNVNFICSDWQSFGWPKAHYDNIAGIFFQFADPQDRAQIFQKMDESLKPGGLLIIQGYGEKQLEYKTGGPGVLENLYTEELLKEAFPHYEIVELVTYEQEILEGDGHDGMSSLVGMAAKKI